MKNTLVRSIFGKALAIGFLTTVLGIASYAQAGNLYEANSSYKFGFITAYQSTWVINQMNGGGEIKIYNCRYASGTDISCSFTQFNAQGKTSHSGQAYITRGGAVYLRWQYDFTSGYQRNADSGWRAYQVR